MNLTHQFDFNCNKIENSECAILSFELNDARDILQMKCDRFRNERQSLGLNGFLER